LATAEIEVSRPLEEYGLNSVSAVALMRELHRRFGIAVPVNLLYEARSLAALAGRLKTESTPSTTSLEQVLRRTRDTAYEPVVPIRPGSGKASFWLHGAPGDASWVARLADALSGDTPVYGIEARGVNGKEAPHRSVTSMARDYVAALRRVQPEGPYRLGGYSGGGVIAYEMARQLQSCGESIGRLVLLDAYAPSNPALRAMGGVYGEGFIYQLSVNWFGRRWGLTQPLAASALEGLAPAAQLEASLDHLYRHARPDVERARLADYLQGMDRVGRSLGKALETYTPKPLGATIDTLLIRCTAGMSGPDNPYSLPTFLAEADYTEGWENLLGGPLHQATVDCDHFSLLDEPWIGQAAAAINRFFEAEDSLPATVPESAGLSLHERTRQVVEEEVRRVLMLDLPEGIPPNTSLAGLGAHSVDRAEVAAAAMERLDVTVPLTALAGIADIDGLVDVLAKGVAGRGKPGHGQLDGFK
jgi:thioesterase domain-containing protein/acyl carrier protein